MPFGWFSDRAGREADKWVVLLGRPLSAEERAEFERWRSNPSNAAAFLRSQQVWSDTGGATRTRASEDRSPVQLAPARQQKLAFVGIAALFAVAIGATMFELQRASGPIEHGQYAAASARTFTLADGSIIDLGNNSQLATNFDGQIRALRLIGGQARFTVAHDAAHPFIVTAGDRQIIARGTKFDVALTPHGLMVAMYEGVVEVRRARVTDPSGPGLRLGKGDRLRVVGDQDSVSHDPSTAGTGPKWHVYVATPLVDVVRDASQQGSGAAQRIVIEDPSVAALNVDGEFNLADPRATARQLAAAFDLELRETGDELVLSMRRQRRK